MATTSKSPFVVVANRLPVDRVANSQGSEWRTSPGGLVTALEPVLRQRGGVWIGWPGSSIEDDAQFEVDGLTLKPVKLSSAEVELYYEGMSNSTLWPLYHDGVAKPAFHREWWDAYVEVNTRFADAAAESADRNAVVWVHDYQLQLVPAMLRKMRPDVRIGFFLHIPFPPTELFKQLPWRDQILQGLLGADLVGFQRPGGAANFARLVRLRLGHKTHQDKIHLGDARQVVARAFPISIDFTQLEKLARTSEVQARADQIRAEFGDERTILLGVDRLDYTKGIRQRLRAFGELIVDSRVSVEDAVFVQVASPSRERVEQYIEVRHDIERWVGRINGDLGRIGSQPIHYMHASFPREEMAALFRAADVMVVTPFADGMNLVAKEYVTCRYENDGALVLSEFAGAADELKQAFLVNPHDINGLRDTMLAAMTAHPKDLSRRMRAMRRHVREHDIASWASAFLTELTGENMRPESPSPR
ncbi:MAG: trehalose-6-phosphate synthase [Propionibacteriales bacterium]|nr:trehalose-6-phosphate synthase [Propionibacteriales bacterium]